MSPLLQLMAGATLTHGTGLAAAVTDTLVNTIGLWLHVVAATLFLAATAGAVVVGTSGRHVLAKHEHRR